MRGLFAVVLFGCLLPSYFVTCSLNPSVSRTLREIEILSTDLRATEWVQRVQQDEDYEVCYEEACLDTALELLNAINFTVDPCKDFYRFSCGKWFSSNPVPSTDTRYGRPHVLYNKINKINQEILTGPVNSSDPKPVNQVKEFYKECINEEKLEMVGVEPIRNLLGEIGGWHILNPTEWSESDFDLIESIAKVTAVGATPSIISVFVWRDIKNSTMNVIFMDQTSLGISRNVLANADQYQLQLEAYKTYIIDVARELGSVQSIESITDAAQKIIDFEILLANATVPPEDRYETHLLHNPYLLNEFLAKLDEVDSEYHIDLKRLLQLTFASSGIIITDDEYITAPGELYFTRVVPILKDASPEVMANYLGWRAIQGLAVETNLNMRNITAQFNQALSGAAQPFIAPKPQSCAATANYVFGMALGYKYVEQEFEKEGKILAKEMVENLRVSFKELLNEADWLENVTLSAALMKADAITGLMAYPDWLEDETGLERFYAGLELSSSEDAHFQNKMSIAQWSLNKSFTSLRIPNTEEEWVADPAIVSAMYSPQHNSVTVPAGMLQPPFFGRKRPASQNFGGIGVVMGHEISHGFDTQGANFDANGNAENWWDDVTRERFLEKAECMENQYSKYCFPSIDMCINGKLTIGENIADNGGLRESFRAYRQYVDRLGKEEPRLPGLEQLTPDQLFFIAYANIRCESITDEGLAGAITSGPHSPNEYRVNGPIRNSLDFASVFACPEDSEGMNPPQSEKCSVW